MFPNQIEYRRVVTSYESDIKKSRNQTKRSPKLLRCSIVLLFYCSLIQSTPKAPSFTHFKFLCQQVSGCFFYRLKTLSHPLYSIVQLAVFDPGTAAVVLKPFSVFDLHGLQMQGREYFFFHIRFTWRETERLNFVRISFSAAVRGSLQQG